MTIDRWLTTTTKRLASAGIGTARLDCLVLLGDVLEKQRSWLLAHPESIISEQPLRVLTEMVSRRQQHEPLAYIRQKTEFYGREFIINSTVLEPRPESETMIELLKKQPLPQQIIDVGTGSGALAITAKLELPDCNVIAIDIDPRCLVVARDNAKKHRVKINFLKGDLLSPLVSSQFSFCDSILLANLPYVPDSYQINEAAAMEPHHAIFGGEDGLDLYRNLFAQISTSKTKPTHIITESLPFQHTTLAAIARDYLTVETVDLIQIFQLKE